MAQEIEFRDGTHVVLDHVAALIRNARIDPTTMTYEQAVRASETSLLRSHLESVQRKFIATHFREHRR